MSDDILDAYDRILESHAVPFGPIEGPDDWHLTVFVLPSFEAETIYDLDRRAGRTLLYRTRLLPSLWLAMAEGRRHPGRAAPLSVERACAELPAGHPLAELVRGEHVFRMRSLEAAGLDGTGCTLVHAHQGGALRLSAWEPSRDPLWARLLEEVGRAAELLPPPA